MNHALKKILARGGLVLFGALLLFAAEVMLRFVWNPPPQVGEQLAAVAIDPFIVEKGLAKTRSTYLAAFRESSFSVPKQVNTFRIFCLGGSTTLGYPYAADVAWPASLARRLQKLFPERRIEVINLGGTSYGSSRTLALLRGVLRYQPDLIIVATGDAEFVEDSFRVAVETRMSPLGFLQRLYLSRVLKAVLPAKQPEVTVDAEDQTAAGFLFAPAPTGTVYQVGPGRRRIVNGLFRENLDKMLKVAEQSDVPIMLSTLPANVASWPPDVDDAVPSESVVRMKWQQLVAEGQELERLGRRVPALSVYHKAARIWSENASFCYNYGQLLLRNGEIKTAREMLLKAVELDPAPVRATDAVNLAIRDVAERATIPLVDVVRRFEKLVPGGIIGEGLILDYAHPTPRGHAEIAAEILDEVGGLGPRWQFKEREAETLHLAELTRIERSAPEISADLSFVLGQILERKGLIEKAEDMYRQAIAQGSQSPFARLNLARSLAGRGEIVAALEHARDISREYPALTETYSLLGYLYEKTGEPSRAIDWYRRALNAGDRSRGLFLSLGQLLLSSNQAELAWDVFRDGLTSSPGNCQIVSWLGRSAEETPVRVADAENIYRDQLAADPGCQLASENLGILLMNQQRWIESRVVFERAISKPNPFSRHHLNLGYIFLKGLGDISAAKEQFLIYQQLEPNDSGAIPVGFRIKHKSGKVRR